MSIPQDFKRVLRFAESKGWYVEALGSGHVRVVSPGGLWATLPSTPGDHRAFANSVADLRRLGLELPRKAPRPKQRPITESPEIAACEALGWSLDLETWPHITAIIGQWRGPDWFTEDGDPKSEVDTGMTERQATACVLLDHVEADAASIGREIRFYVSDEKIATIPKGRHLRTRVDAWRYWAVDQGGPPLRCTCGQKYMDQQHGPFALVQHIVSHHERALYDHAPVHDDITPYEEPDQLIELMVDPVADELERWKETAARHAQDAERWRSKHIALVRAMQRVIEDAG